MGMSNSKGEAVIRIVEKISREFIEAMRDEQAKLKLTNIESVSVAQTALAVIIGETSVAASAMGGSQQEFINGVIASLSFPEIIKEREIARDMFFKFRRKSLIKEVQDQ
jgi:hypothetical protein